MNSMSKCFTAMVRVTSLASVIGLSTYSSAAVADTGPKVVVSILPIHSLVQSVMDGVGDAELLVDQKASPHGYSLRPSQVRALNKADLIVWVGEGLETFLEKPLSQQPANTTVLELMDLKTIHLLENRTAGTWDEHHAEEGHGDHEEEGGHDHDENHNHGKYDPHIWLSLDNSRAIVKRVGSELVKIDPDNAQLYHKNVEVTLASLGLMKQDISAQMSNVKNKPYLVFHDAYQYFEQEFSLNSIGSVTIDPERKPGAKRLTELREHIRLSGAVCIFSEPQFKPAVVNVLSEGLAIKKGELDPMGSEFEAGKMAYGQLLNGLAGSITECLSD